HVVRIDPMGDTEAARMLMRRASGRLDAEPSELVASLAATCGGLPLAVALVAAQLVVSHQSAQILASMHGNALEIFQSTDPDTDLRTILSWSYRRLSLGGQKLIRCIAAAPGSDLDPEAAGSLIRTAPETA